MPPSFGVGAPPPKQEQMSGLPEGEGVQLHVYNVSAFRVGAHDALYMVLKMHQIQSWSEVRKMLFMGVCTFSAGASQNLSVTGLASSLSHFR